MAKPNLANINYYAMLNVTSNLFGLPTSVLQNLPNSNSIAKITGLYLNNFMPNINQVLASIATTTANVIVTHYDFSSNTYMDFVSTSVPRNTVLQVISKDNPLILDEGDELLANVAIDFMSGNIGVLPAAYGHPVLFPNASISVDYELITDQNEIVALNSPANPLFVELLAVAGGGGGGRDFGGGGGAGGLIYSTRYGFPYGSNLTITIGGGGGAASQGGNTCISNTSYGINITAYGGGRGIGPGDASCYYGGNGGSGGSIRGDILASPNYLGGIAIVYTGSRYNSLSFNDPRINSRQGHPGGGSYHSFGNGGGGGASQRGHTSYGPSYGGGRGGNGCFIDISGTFQWYAGGGGGIAATAYGGGPPGPPGCGGGPTSNFGGGATGGGISSSGGAGGSGIFILRYPQSLAGNSVTTGPASANTSGTYRTYCFTGSGTIRLPTRT